METKMYFFLSCICNSLLFLIYFVEFGSVNSFR